MKSRTSGPQGGVCVGAGKIFRLLVASAFLLLLCPPAFPQLNLGNITGTVTDPTVLSL